MSRKRFVYNEELWNSGIFHGCTYEKGCLKAIPEELGESAQKAVYISTALDSGEKETVWSRLKINFTAPGESYITVSYFSSDEKEVYLEDEKINLEEFIEDFSVHITEKLYYLDKLWIKIEKNTEDMLLHSAKGRYLWFKIEMVTFDNKSTEIRDLEIEFPLESIIEYLPAFYRENKENFQFLSRFLGLYQSLIYDLQHEIDNVSKYFDIDFTDREFLLWLSKWVGIEYPLIWEEEKFKAFVKNSFAFYQKKGTKECMEQVLTLYLGNTPKILETYKILEFYEGRTYDDDAKRLYSDDIYSFFVFVEDSWIKNTESLQNVKKIVESFKPAYTNANLVVLKPAMILGEYTYLGVNSCLGESSRMEINDNFAMPFDSIICN
ncbi:MAG: hypothetical protein GX299_10160 [Epulopiscium sp.]|nr:hypothetical protein [Candidatus Epulonipiscium sp.]